jgi:hypothetical protein
LLRAAEKGGTDGRDWNEIRRDLANCIYEEQRPTATGADRLVYRLRPEVAADLARQCVYVEQGRSSKARWRPVFERMKRDAAGRKFDRLLVWKVSRLGRDMRQVVSTVYELADLGVTVIPLKSQTGPINSSIGKAAVGVVCRDGERREIGGDQSRPGQGTREWQAPGQTQAYL